MTTHTLAGSFNVAGLIRSTDNIDGPTLTRRCHYAQRLEDIAAWVVGMPMTT